MRVGVECLPERFRSVVSVLVSKLLEFFNGRLVSVVVFGSVARGDFRVDSDLDVLIVVEGLPRSRLKRQDLFMEVESRVFSVLGFQVEFSPILKTPSEAERFSPLYLDMVEDAVIVYDRDDFFKSVLERLSEKLKSLGAKRVFLGKKWYWILKENCRFGEVITIE